MTCLFLEMLQSFVHHFTSPPFKIFEIYFQASDDLCLFEELHTVHRFKRFIPKTTTKKSFWNKGWRHSIICHCRSQCFSPSTKCWREKKKIVPVCKYCVTTQKYFIYIYIVVIITEWNPQKWIKDDTGDTYGISFKQTLILNTTYRSKAQAFLKMCFKYQLLLLYNFSGNAIGQMWHMKVSNLNVCVCGREIQCSDHSVSDHSVSEWALSSLYRYLEYNSEDVEKTYSSSVSLTWWHFMRTTMDNFLYRGYYNELQKE